MLPRTWGSPAPSIITGSRRCAVRCNAVMSAAQFSLFHILKLVNEQGHAGSIRFRGGSNHFQQILKVGFQVSVVRQAWFRLKIQTDLNVLVLYFQSTGESGQSSETAFSKVFHGLTIGEFQQRGTHLRRQHRRKRAVFGGFNPQCVDASRFGVFPDTVQQHGFTNTPQPHHEQAFVGTP